MYGRVFFHYVFSLVLPLSYITFQISRFTSPLFPLLDPGSAPHDLGQCVGDAIEEGLFGDPYQGLVRGHGGSGPVSCPSGTGPIGAEVLRQLAIPTGVNWLG